MVGSIFRPVHPFFAATPIKPGVPVAMSATTPSRVPPLDTGLENPLIGELLPHVLPPSHPGETSAMASQHRAEQQLRLQRALADPNLSVEYRGLLKQLFSDYPTLTTLDLAFLGEQAGILQRLAAQLIDDYQAFDDAYEGFQKVELPAVTAVNSALVILYGQDVADALFQDIEAQVGDQMLTESERVRKALLDLRYEVLQQFQSALPGPKRQRIYDKLRLIGQLVRQAEISDHDVLADEIRRVYPTLDPADRDLIVKLREGAAKPRAWRDRRFRTELRAGVSHFYKLYLDEQQNALAEGKWLVYLSVVQSLTMLAFDLGESLQTLRRNMPERPIDWKKRQVTMEDLKKGTVICTPDEMPVEIQKVLKETGQWEEFRKRTRIVILTPQIKLNEQQRAFIGMDADGIADFIGRTVIVATSYGDGTGKRYPFEEDKIGSLGGHEAEHIRYVDMMPSDPEERRVWLATGPNERNSYSVEASILRGWLAYLEEREPEQLLSLRQLKRRLALKQNIFERETLIYGTNLLLGLPVADTTPGRTDFSAPSWLSGTVDDIRNMALNDYPTKLRALLRTKQLRDRKANTELRTLKKSLRKRLDQLESDFEEVIETFQADQAKIYHRKFVRDPLSAEEMKEIHSFLTSYELWLHQMRVELRLPKAKTNGS